MAKVDLESAFKHIIVKKEQWDLLGFSMKCKNAGGHIERKFYMCTCLPFRLSSAPKLFDMYAESMEYIMYSNCVTFVCHYLDDSFVVANKHDT